MKHIVLPLATSLLTLAGSVLAQAQGGAYTGSYTKSLTVTNPCNGETVALTGDVHWTTEYVMKNGVFYTSRHNDEYSLGGVGSLGNEYVYHLNVHTVLNADNSDPAKLPHTYEGSGSSRVISKGGAPNFTMSYRFTQTFGTDLQLLSETFEPRTECSGN